MTLIRDLEKIGLNKKEAKAYLSLLELGEASIQRISSKSGIKRTTVYDVIASLKKKGLLGVTSRGNRTFYYAEDPRKIDEQLNEQKKVLGNILPELLSVANFIDKKPRIRYFEGIDGIKEVYRDTLSYPNNEILAWASHEAVQSFDVDYLWKTYVPQRIENKIWARVIAPDNEDMRELKSYDEKHLRQIKLIPDKEFPFEVEINLYGNSKIGIMSFEEQIGLILESKKIYNTLKSMFELSWKKL